MREAGSRIPNGILQENAMYPVVFPILNDLLLDGADIAGGQAPGEPALERMHMALQEYARQGFTTVTEMGATPDSLALLNEMASQQSLAVDVIAVALSKAYTTEQVSELYSPDYHQNLRVGGSKIILDGGSPGRSAFLRIPYHVQLDGEQEYRGYPHIAEQAELNALMLANHSSEIPLYIHALGDAAVDQAITGLQYIQKTTSKSASRPQLIHVQQAGEDQLELLSKLGATLTFQVAHNYYFGDYHQQTIYGPQRTARLNPANSALRHGLSVSIHHDSPVHPINQFTLIWAAVNRLTRSGRTIGPEEKISVLEALQASTVNAAFQFFEEDQKGTIEAGKLADLVILSDNPLTIGAERLNEITVVQTFKRGKTIYPQ